MAAIMDRNSWDDGAGDTAIANFNREAAQLEALIAQRNQDVQRAMADYQADGVSDEYRAKEQRWNAAADEVKTIIQKLRASLEDSQSIAATTAAAASRAVADIG